ncbi:ABC transporter ATP-binding protein [Niabella drilacis]|uniref:ABC-2 type transport system ATP-binding protein n=1 Tax=Niabella drilacis (strain DSM 25811 / CCM 8410 / CCUG 62505 / LMG 26954 / E90) TaxID=1285928 RepID=A0A1G7B5B7_NIADE|nr:ABC transporter ATP-binding protein [Niabella drilacis]SDE22269.1 ABC-2 type transport system ATP-binding protein [Niabella drilacis]
MEAPIIELKGLTKCYRSLRAVDDLDLTINKGEIFGLLGPNGAGKSTTILMLLGLTEPTSGVATVCGFNATKNPIPVKQKVGYMPDNIGFYNNMTALENLVYVGRLNGIAEAEVKERAREMLEEVGLSGAMNKRTATFSRGMKQRLGLADVLIKQPEVIILDEPTLGIDPSGVKDFLALIKQLSRQQGLTVLLSSHHLHQVQQVCDRVGIFVGGKLLAEGNIDTLAGNLFAREPFVVEVTVQNPVPPTLETDLLAIETVKKVLVNDHLLQISGSTGCTPDLVRFLVQKGMHITGVQQRSYGLDEIYERYFETNLNENSSSEKSSGLFQRSFFRKRK